MGVGQGQIKQWILAARSKLYSTIYISKTNKESADGRWHITFQLGDARHFTEAEKATVVAPNQEFSWESTPCRQGPRLPRKISEYDGR